MFSGGKERDHWHEWIKVKQGQMNIYWVDSQTISFMKYNIPLNKLQNIQILRQGMLYMFQLNSFKTHFSNPATKAHTPRNVPKIINAIWVSVNLLNVCDSSTTSSADSSTLWSIKASCSVFIRQTELETPLTSSEQFGLFVRAVLDRCLIAYTR